MNKRKTLDQMNSNDLDALYAEIDRLHAGEEDGWDPLLVPTPGQWIARFNRATPQERHDAAKYAIDNSTRAGHCFLMAHEKRLAEDRHAWVALARIRDVIADMEQITGARHWARILRKVVDGDEPKPAGGPATARPRACRYCPDPSCPEDCPECGAPIHDLDAVPSATPLVDRPFRSLRQSKEQH